MIINDWSSLLSFSGLHIYQPSDEREYHMNLKYV